MPALQIDHNSMALERAPLVLRDTVEASIEMVAADARRKGGCPGAQHLGLLAERVWLVFAGRNRISWAVALRELAPGTC